MKIVIKQYKGMRSIFKRESRIGWKVIRLKGSEINRDVYDCVKYVERIIIRRREKINKLVKKYEFYRFKK